MVLEDDLEADGVEFDDSRSNGRDHEDSDGGGGVNGDVVHDEVNDRGSRLKCEGSSGVNLECCGSEGRSDSDSQRNGSASPMNLGVNCMCKSGNEENISDGESRSSSASPTNHRDSSTGDRHMQR